MEPRGYDYGGSSGAGGKIRRRPPSRAAAASPYARPAPAPSPAAAAASQGSGWLSRIIAAGTSRLLPSLFRKPPPQLTAPAPPPPPQLTAPAPSPPPELVGESPSRVWLPETRPEALNALPSSLPPPLGLCPHLRLLLACVALALLLNRFSCRCSLAISTGDNNILYE